MVGNLAMQLKSNKRVIIPGPWKSIICWRITEAILRLPNQHSKARNSQWSPRKLNPNQLVEICLNRQSSKPLTKKTQIPNVRLKMVNHFVLKHAQVQENMSMHKITYVQQKLACQFHNSSISLKTTTRHKLNRLNET